MATFITDTLKRLGRWLRRRGFPVLAGPTGPGLLDYYRRQRAPTPAELLAELKGAAWTCASLNASTCASFPPRLYVTTRPGEPWPKCLTKQLPARVETRLRALPHLVAHTRGAAIQEVDEHPLLTLLGQVNPAMNSFDLWELTTLYQETVGSAYWYLDVNALGVPNAIWPLPAHCVTSKREAGSTQLVDYYLYRQGGDERRFPPERIIHFRYPDPRDPYTAGLSPLRAAFEEASLLSESTAFRRAKLDNHAVPAAIVSPDAVIGEEERDRLEVQWHQRFRRGGSGRVVVSESPLKVQLLSHSMGDLAALADSRATKEDVANAFHVPLAFLTSETNLANLQAAEHQHTAKAILPRLRRRDEKLNEQLVPWFDPTGRLFFASDDPVPVNRELNAKEQELYLKYGVVTVNEVRGDLGLPPVPWGDGPQMPLRPPEARS
jgi:HK97 family phage portal protein